MQRKMNWFGIAAGIATIILVAVSVFIPWWQLNVGTNLAQVNASPTYTDIILFGKSLVSPLILALNIEAVLLLTVGGIAMLIYSVVPTKPYATRLLSFSYRKPLYSVVFFAATLIVLWLVVDGLFGFNVPLTGSASVRVPSDMIQGFSMSALVSAGFQWPFWLGVATAALCIAARIYHKKVVTQQISQIPSVV